MSDEKVIDIKSRRPYAVAKAEEAKQRRAAKRQAKKQWSEVREEHKSVLLEVLDQVRARVADGKLEGLILLAREPTTKLFLTEVVLDDRLIPPNDLHSYVGCMETLKIELADGAAMAPALLNDGSVIDPSEQIDEEYDGYE
jgi:hypothetical protein